MVGFHNTEERWKWREGKQVNECVQRTLSIHPDSIWKFQHFLWLFSLFVISLHRVMNLIHDYTMTVSRHLFKKFQLIIHLKVRHANRGGMCHGMKEKLQPNPLTGYIKEDRGDLCYTMFSDSVSGALLR